MAGALEAGALAQGYATDLWTQARVGKLIEKISSKRYSESGVWRLLKGLKFSCQRPSGRTTKRDEAAVQHWKKKRWPALKNCERRPNHRLHRRVRSKRKTLVTAFWKQAELPF